MKKLLLAVIAVMVMAGCDNSDSPYEKVKRENEVLKNNRDIQLRELDLRQQRLEAIIELCAKMIDQNRGANCNLGQ